MECDTPVAAFPVTGPLDFIENGKNGILNEDLKIGAIECLDVSRKTTYESVQEYSWERCTTQFLYHLEQIKNSYFFLLGTIPIKSLK